MGCPVPGLSPFFLRAFTFFGRLVRPPPADRFRGPLPPSKLLRAGMEVPCSSVWPFPIIAKTKRIPFFETSCSSSCAAAISVLFAARDAPFQRLPQFPKDRFFPRVFSVSFSDALHCWAFLKISVHHRYPHFPPPGSELTSDFAPSTWKSFLPKIDLPSLPIFRKAGGSLLSPSAILPCNWPPVPLRCDQKTHPMSSGCLLFFPSSPKPVFVPTPCLHPHCRRSPP